MRRYLNTLHKRSDRHKQNFALLVSGGVTLMIFGGWYFVNYGSPSSPQVVQENSVRELPAQNEVGPFESLTASIGEAWEGIQENISGLFENIGSVDLDEGYEEMKVRTLDTYVR